MSAMDPRSTLGMLAAIEKLMEDQGNHALERLRKFLTASCGSILRAWLKYLDTNVDYRIDKLEFMEGMRQLNYPASEIPQLFCDIDVDRSEEITLDELDKDASVLWHKFRAWSVQTFYGVDDMILTLASDESHASFTQTFEISREHFRNGLQRLDWKEGDEDVLFDALNFDGDGFIKSHCLRWLGIELKRIRKKRMAKENAAKKKMPGVSWEALERQFVDFKEHLRKRYGNGNLVRAWRVALSETMILPKTRFLKACVGMGYAKKAKELWKVLDKDESGFASIDELDPKSAKVLAHFKNSLDQRFSSIALAFDFLDVDGTRKIRRNQFEAALRRLEFPFPERASELFECLDLNGNHVLEEDDIQFLEKWRPAPILTAEKNPKAREEFRELLLQRYGRPVKAWRHLLDRDGSNRCNWHEFLAACKVIGFKGDLAGAWRALDDDLSGYITLKELDKEGYRTLWDFRTWAVDEFGSARAAFSVFDSDGSNSLSSQEFRAACRIYGYDAEGQIKQLFNTLDVSAEGTLSLKEVAFLDDWIEDPQEPTKVRTATATLSAVSSRGDPTRRGALVGQEELEEMQQKVLAMEEAEERLRTWRRPVKDPMKVVNLCRKIFGPPQVLSNSNSTRHLCPVPVAKLARLDGPDFCRGFVMKQNEPPEVTAERERRKVPPLRLPPLVAPVPVPEIAGNTGNAAVAPDVPMVPVAPMKPRHSAKLSKPTLDDLLRLGGGPYSARTPRAKFVLVSH